MALSLPASRNAILALERETAGKPSLSNVVYLPGELVAKPGTRRRLEHELDIGRRLAQIEIPAPDMHEVVYLPSFRRSFLLMSRLHGETLKPIPSHKPYVERLRRNLLRIVNELNVLPIDGEFTDNVIVSNSGELALLDFEYWRHPKSHKERATYLAELRSPHWTPDYSREPQLN